MKQRPYRQNQSRLLRIVTVSLSMGYMNLPVSHNTKKLNRTREPVNEPGENGEQAMTTVDTVIITILVLIDIVAFLSLVNRMVDLRDGLWVETTIIVICGILIYLVARP